MELLRHEGVDLEGAEAVVVGRSKLVGVPVARLLLSANATVTVCHSRTRDLPAVCRRADVLVAAVGVPRLLGADAVKPGAVVIDVGMNRTEDGLCGDVDLRGGGGGRGGDHAGARRGRPDDDRDAARQHPRRRPSAGVVSAQPSIPRGVPMIERPSPGEQVAGIAGLALILTMFLFAWYGVDVPGVNGFDAFDAFGDWFNIILVFAAFAGMVLASVRQRVGAPADLAQRGDDRPRRARRRSSC